METDSEDEDQESKTAFDELLATTKTFKRKASEVEEGDEDGPHDPGGEYYGVGYLRTLRWPVDPDDPLIGNAYVGQAVRTIGKQYPTALALATARWKEEDRAAARGAGSDVCLQELLRLHGSGAFENVVVSERRGPKSKMKEWADRYEKAEIASRGGPMRDMEPQVHIFQTLNRTSGGQGEPTINWDAVSSKAWATFKAELELYVATTGDALVPSIYVAPSGYKLGHGVCGVRNGQMVDGHPDRREWLDSLPDWSWNTRDHPWTKFKEALESYVSDHGHSLVPTAFVTQSGYKLGQTVDSVRGGSMRKDKPERDAWLDSLPGWEWNAEKAKRATRLALARSSALPYEPITSKRVAGAFYLGKPGSDDMILQAKINLQYRKVCPRVPPS